MPVHVIVGAQWGDEGKGKIVDHLSEQADIVARYQGGANAGHTVVFEGREHVLHLIPSGIFHPRVTCVIGNGAVIDPMALMSEIGQLEDLGVDITGRLLISHNAHLIMPYHKLLDTAREETAEKIGTTGRGIGPAYIDKVMRTGIRIADLLNRDLFAAKLKRNIEEKNLILKKIYARTELDVAKIVCEYEEFDKKIDEYVTDTAVYLNAALKEGRTIIAEGAQGALLDVDHGTYPFVTSSNPTSGGACTGLGIPPTAVTSVMGVAKAYSTRVGNGPFPTELPNELGARLRETGGEYGATTGRPRRCGWLDMVSLKYSIMINGIQELALTKLDVLDSFDRIEICAGYRTPRKVLNSFPTDAETLDSVFPEFASFEGWKTPTGGITAYAELPPSARRYIEAVSTLAGVPVTMVSVGASRHQTIAVPRPSA